MIKEWNRFEKWLEEKYMSGYKTLNVPASDEQIQQLEIALSVKLPEDFIQFLKIHNGQDPEVEFSWLRGIVAGEQLLSIKEIIEQCNFWNEMVANGEFDEFFEERDNGVKGDWWNTKWIPFTHDGSGNHICIDLDPSNTGTMGQVIRMYHDDDYRPVEAPSFQEWFAQYLDRLEAGEYDDVMSAEN